MYRGYEFEVWDGEVSDGARENEEDGRVESARDRSQVELHEVEL